MLGLPSDLDLKNCWSIAEHRGAKTPNALQHVLSRSVWDAELIRDDLRGCVIDNLGHLDAVLVVDETRDLKRGVHSVGVQRQYTGTAGRIEYSQVAVYLAYASPTGHSLIDRALYLPASLIQDPDRCAAAGIPEGSGPELPADRRPPPGGRDFRLCLPGADPGTVEPGRSAPS